MKRIRLLLLLWLLVFPLWEIAFPDASWPLWLGAGVAMGIVSGAVDE